jgi:membrane-bound lytic murein transglycosylase D
VRHKIKRGETVSSIAAKYGVSQYAIFEANNLRRTSRIYAGKELIVPVPLDRDYSASKRKKNRRYTAKNSVYVVRSGDTMWDIARAFGTTVSALRRINYIERGSRIYVGQRLKIPSDARYLKQKNKSSPKRYASTHSKSSRKSSSSGSKKSSEKKYTVRAGDTLWDIARKFGTTTGKLRRLNGLGRSSRIYPGQVLRVVSDGGRDYVVHRVRRGDTLTRIARRYRTSISKILATNNIDDPDQLKVGDKLKIYIK